MNTVLVYSHQLTPRLQYIADFIFQTILQIELCLTSSKDDLSLSSAFIINYSNEPIPEAHLQIYPHGLLSETCIRDLNPDMSIWENSTIFFCRPETEIPFDLFAAAFYLLSRYEEYQPFESDDYQRYPVEKSLAYRHQFLTQPLIDQWAAALKKIMTEKDVSMRFNAMQKQFLPTYDIDIAYSYRGKGWIRNLGGFLRDILHGQLSLVQDRLHVLFRNKKDPFDTFEWMDKLHQRYHLNPVYFFLLGDGSRYDKNIAHTHPSMQALIKSISAAYQTGIHPSYRSAEDINILKNEIKRLNTTKSRQHYIRFRLPETFEQLIACGIQDDYSMGYGSMNGFRASTAYTHAWYNLHTEEITTLQLHPFCFMECNSFFEQQQHIEETRTELNHYTKMILQTGGTLISIWHNFSLGTDPIWQGWNQLYAEWVDEIITKKYFQKER